MHGAADLARVTGPPLDQRKKITSLFLTLMIDSWDALFKAIAHGSKAQKLELDTS
ncbi:hypothetical protein [Endozoicomonas acroporae]|uniref:hypothetical protein n=1 Tax=Endozoicomonas acroporae TaxID=1701104 RepID=UPI003D79EAF1